MQQRHTTRSQHLKLFVTACAFCGLVPLASYSQTPGTTAPSATQTSAPVYTVPLGIAMETVSYPYPVQYLPLMIDGESLRMAYMDVPPVGAANGRTVLLLHGKNFYGSYWENTIKALTDAGFRVVVPDQIGFGKSSKPSLHYSFDLLAANTAQLLDHLQVPQVAVVGHSMGGMLAVRFARNYPQRTSRLVLEDPIGLEDYRFKLPPQSDEKLFQDELNAGDPAKVRAVYQHYVVSWQPEVYECFVEIRARIALGGEYPRFAKASALTTQMIYQQPVRHEFSLIQAPTLLVIGQADRTTIGRGWVGEDVLRTLGQYPQIGRAAAHDIPNCKFVEIPNVGHIPHLEAPTRFHQELLDFLR
ncbi:MAG: alpha/beta hydrolase [Abitibacteriaceae bacterium]|nr:alpha/beta hydrolase [Abditibacteriaceae bacterium]MBV9865764.1 alpha/beta hydrolase [Abditibacteriaceae bacterium]